MPRVSRRFCLQRSLAEVPGLCKEIDAFVKEHGASTEEAINLRIAITEACNNAIQYAISDKALELEAQIQNGIFRICIIDHTRGFDLPANPELPDSDSESGRGLFLMRQLMDTVEYFQNPAGNRLVMTYRLKTAKDPTPPTL